MVTAVVAQLDWSTHSRTEARGVLAQRGSGKEEVTVEAHWSVQIEA
jgi:hypothetical protein